MEQAKRRHRGINGSITAQWVTRCLLVTLVILAALEGLFLTANRSSYYSGVQQAIENRFSGIGGQLKAYTSSSLISASAARETALHRMVEQFDEKDKLEFMLLDSSGRILTTSSGVIKASSEVNSDFTDALESADGIGQCIYTTAENEKVMAVTSLVPYAAGDVAAMRMVTSLTLVDRALARRAWASLLLVAVVLGFSAFSGVYFVRGIVTPLHQVEQTAHSIAAGNLNARLTTKGRGDEIDRLCDAINQMANDLGETERLKNEFISSVSHELRTPLTSIKGWVETIAAIRDPEDEDYRRGLAVIGAETDRLYEMVEELLDFSRMQSGVKMECRVIDLVAELTDAALFFSARIHNAGLHLAYDEPEVILPVYADPKRLRQVFVNVLDNAVKYSEPGGTITIEVLQESDHVYVLVRDQGRGIAPDDLENVKIKFFKGKNAVRGSGIGLAVVDSILSALDGSLDLESTLGEGTTVKIMLPLHKGEQADREKA